ncbi:jg22619 [Pararge aegeria aegeria]|uniref:Jg22619 protein n=1 Tax=Pararge aegeria aegeria TaxID=348720 RepID=A0A8S4QPE8_9NEOP|nr:jg22619 [Pararge aegeria aegeria]
MKQLNNLGGSLRTLAAEYNTKIVGFYLGPYATVVIDDPKLIKKGLYNEDFDGRLDIIVARMRSYWKTLGDIINVSTCWNLLKRYPASWGGSSGYVGFLTTKTASVANLAVKGLSRYDRSYTPFGIPSAPSHSVLCGIPVCFTVITSGLRFTANSKQVLTKTTMSGIFFTDGYFWHVQRRFTLRYMRDYGFGRREESLEAVVASETKEMIDMARNGPKYPAENELVKGDLICLQHFFDVPFMNGMVHIFARTTFPRSEYKVLFDLARATLLFQRGTNDFGGALTITPWLKDVLPGYSGYSNLKKGNQALLNFFDKIIKHALATHDKTYDRHFLDVYIKKWKEEETTVKKTTFSEHQLQLVCTDYMFPAATGVQSVLTFLLERILLQPEIQDKIHEEIDRVVGRDRLPTLDDRRNMPYTEACIREIMRYEPLVPLGVPHRAMKASKFGGYDIPEVKYYSYDDNF